MQRTLFFHPLGEVLCFLVLFDMAPWHSRCDSLTISGLGTTGTRNGTIDGPGTRTAARGNQDRPANDSGPPREGRFFLWPAGDQFGLVVRSETSVGSPVPWSSIWNLRNSWIAASAAASFVVIRTRPPPGISSNFQSIEAFLRLSVGTPGGTRS